MTKKFYFKPYIKLFFILILPILLFIFHILIWNHFKGFLIHVKTANQILLYLDSDFYTQIAENGYTAPHHAAFFPLYPLLLKMVSLIFPFKITLQLMGMFISFFLYYLTIVIMGFLTIRAKELPIWLVPKSFYSFLLFFVLPAAYIFHTNHTESLFLFLSFLALYFSVHKKIIIASIFAGLCALTKNQGVLLALSVALICANSAQGMTNYTNKNQNIFHIKKFILSGSISGFLFSFYPIFLYFKFDNAFQFIEAQKNWRNDLTLNSYFANIFNIFKILNTNYIYITEVFYFLFLVGAFLFFVRKYTYPVLYCGLSLFLIPMQISYNNTFRFSLILFPLFFLIGDVISRKNKIIMIGIILFFFYFNYILTRNYALDRWAY